MAGSVCENDIETAGKGNAGGGDYTVQCTGFQLNFIKTVITDNVK